MEISYQTLPGEPISIITLSGHIADGFDIELERKIAGITKQTLGRDYLIIDARGTETSFEDMMKMLRMMDKHEHLEFNLDELAIPPVFVGSNQLVDLYINKALPAFFHVTGTPVFRVVDDALSYVRQHRQQKD